MDTQVVKEIQEALRLLSFYDPRLIPVAVDGVYGHQTADAVRIFQTLYGLNPTGEVDNATWEELRDSANERRTPPPSALYVFPHPEYVLEPDETNVTVGLIQLILQELSRYYNNIKAVDASGTYDAATVKEIQNIQKLHRLEDDGKVNLETWNVLSVLFNNRFDTTRR